MAGRALMQLAVAQGRSDALEMLRRAGMVAQQAQQEAAAQPTLQQPPTPTPAAPPSARQQRAAQHLHPQHQQAMPVEAHNDLARREAEALATAEELIRWGGAGKRGPGGACENMLPPRVGRGAQCEHTGRENFRPAVSLPAACWSCAGGPAPAPPARCPWGRMLRACSVPMAQGRRGPKGWCCQAQGAQQARPPPAAAGPARPAAAAAAAGAGARRADSALGH